MFQSAPDDYERLTNLPYDAGYVRYSTRCQKCSKNIEKDDVRMCDKNADFMGVCGANGYHIDCFFFVYKSSVDEESIGGMSKLKWDDQERIRNNIKVYCDRSPGGPKRHKTNKMQYKFVKVVLAPSGRAKCRKCAKFLKMQRPKFFFEYSWHHFTCFFKKDKIQEFDGKPEDLNGFDGLPDDDKKMIKEYFEAIAKGKDAEAAELGNCIEETGKPPATVQADDNSADDEMGEAVEDEKMEGEGKENGEGGEKRAQEGGATTEQVPENVPEAVSSTDKRSDDELRELLKKQADILWQVREEIKKIPYDVMKTLMAENQLSTPGNFETMVERLVDISVFGIPLWCSKCPLGELHFLSSTQQYSCMGHISNYTKCSNVELNPVRMPFGIPKWLFTRFPNLANLPFNSLSERVYPKAVDAGRMKTKGEAVSAEVAGDRVTTVNADLSKQLVKRGHIMEPDCPVADRCHVYVDPSDGTVYSVTLSNIDLVNNRNSYFKMQLLMDDINEKLCYVFSANGRVGTQVRNIDNFPFFEGVQDAIDHFTYTFHRMTGNKWDERTYFMKKAGKWGMVDMHFKEKVEQSTAVAVRPGSKTKLPQAIQALMTTFFDRDMYKEAMKAFELDMDQMPLGKLTKKQLMKAYGVLNELMKLLESPNPSPDGLLDMTTRFYTLVPHNFGMQKPTLIDTKELVSKKSKLIDNLLDIAEAVDLMDSEDTAIEKEESEGPPDPIDVNYAKLKTTFEVLPMDHADYKMIDKYLKNTHGATHNHYKLRIDQIFKVQRQGEHQRFRSDLGNRMLLWHGSGVSNFVGILSQGLRIAPPEAPVSGYMFGKGIYFADMVSKSANYCRADERGAFLLLCDVALGVVQQQMNATGKNTLSKEEHSVKGVGETYPDPDDVMIHPDGFRVPFGKAKKLGQRISLLYNEYIVYDVRQVEIRYLVRCTVNHR